VNYKVYKIYRIDTKKVVYIGITKNTLRRRFSSHLRDSKRNKKKMDYFSKYKHILRIETIEDNIPDLKTANAKEVYYIGEFSKGYNLLNATIGGDGTKGCAAWNKGKKCTYADKLILNSPMAKKVFCYSKEGEYIREYRSIKHASISEGMPRCAIKNMCEMKPKYKTYKNKTFRYYKSDKIDINFVLESDRIERVRIGKIKKCKSVFVHDKKNGITNKFTNYLECMKHMGIKKATLMTYLSLKKETKKYIFGYE